MNIALVGCSARAKTGGMGRAVFNQAQALAKAGNTVTVYTLAPLPQKTELFKVVELSSWLKLGKAAWGVTFHPSLDNFDVIHLHLPFFGVADHVTNFKRKNPDASLFVTYHMDARGQGLKSLYFKWWYKSRFKNVVKVCDRIAVTSKDFALSSQLKRAGVDVDSCEEILLRVDTNRFAVKSGEESNDPYILFVGGLDKAHYFKGVDVLINALKATSETRLIIVGDGDMRAEYEQKAHSNILDTRISFLGSVSEERLVDLYRGARALVLPSTDSSEAFGMVLAEAMVCGAPVIASDLPGVRETVIRCNGGALVPANEPKQLARAINEVWSKPLSITERIALSQRAHGYYSNNSLSDDLIAFYRGIIKA